MVTTCPDCGVTVYDVFNVRAQPAEPLRLDSHTSYRGEDRYVFDEPDMQGVTPVAADASVAAYPIHDCRRPR